MGRVILVAVLCAGVLCIGGCSSRDSGEVRDVKVGATPQVHQQEKQPDVTDKASQKLQGMAGVISLKKLNNYSQSTIGDAFNSYRFFDSREWKETRVQNGKVYVDFYGWFSPDTLDAASKMNGLVKKGVVVKFAVNTEGAFYVTMISKVEIRTDGKSYSYPLEDHKRVLDAIYGSKELSLP